MDDRETDIEAERAYADTRLRRAVFFNLVTLALLAYMLLNRTP